MSSTLYPKRLDLPAPRIWKPADLCDFLRVKPSWIYRRSTPKAEDPIPRVPGVGRLRFDTKSSEFQEWMARHLNASNLPQEKPMTDTSYMDSGEPITTIGSGLSGVLSDAQFLEYVAAWIDVDPATGIRDNADLIVKRLLRMVAHRRRPLAESDVLEVISFAWEKCQRTSSMADLCEWLQADAENVRPLVIQLRIAKRIEPKGRGWRPAQ